jgi:hypothetical protein
MPIPNMNMRREKNLIKHATHIHSYFIYANTSGDRIGNME